MKLFNKKEEKRSVGRPKLADTITKKKAIISISVALVMVVALALMGAFKLDIINLNKLKGTATITCTEIPAEFQPGGNYEYGFTDLRFYSIVISNIPNSDETFCTSVSKETLENITSIEYSGPISNTDGLQYLANLETLSLTNSGINDINLYGNKRLKSLKLQGNNNLTNINLSENSLLTNLSVARNNLSELDLSNNPNIETLQFNNNPNLKLINLSGNTVLNRLNITSSTSNLETLNLTGVTTLQSVNIKGSSLNELNLSNNQGLYELILENNSKLENLDLTNNNNLTTLRLNGVNGLKLGELPLLNSLYLENVRAEELNLSSMKELTSFYLNSSDVGTLKLEGTTKLTVLRGPFGARSNNINNLILRNNEAITCR